jgi:pimeloyl-ACP methyl ester carboxylesterase
LSFNIRVKGTLAALLAGAIGMSPCAAQSSKYPDNELSTFPRERVTSILNDVRKVATADGIEELKAVPIGGIQQWISVRGRSRDNPILLFLHGGPASTEMPAAWTFQGPWEDYFVVVQWDQRGAGKTYTANDPESVGPTIRMERMIADAEELAQYLRATYARQKIFVLGHSWGSVLGLELARRQPQWLHAYIGMGQIINMRESERLGYEFVLRTAAAAQNETALTELRSIAPYPEADGSIPIDKLDLQRKWSVRFGGLTHGRTAFNYYSNATLLSPDYSAADVAAVDRGSALSLPRLWPQLMKVDFMPATELQCPIVIFNGRHDHTTSAVLAARWFEKVRAPAKRLVWFENSAHMTHMEEPGRVLVHLVNDVLPLAAQERNAKPRAQP